MNTKAMIEIIAISVACANCAMAQSTLGEAIEKGAEIVLRDEFLSLLPITLSAVTASGKAEATLKYKADGTLSGHVTSLGGHGTSGSFGTWTIDETGKRCIDETLTTWNMKYTGCTYMFKLDGRYFRASEDLARDQKITFFKATVRDN